MLARPRVSPLWWAVTVCACATSPARSTDLLPDAVDPQDTAPSTVASDDTDGGVAPGADSDLATDTDGATAPLDTDPAPDADAASDSDVVMDSDTPSDTDTDVGAVADTADTADTGWVPSITLHVADLLPGDLVITEIMYSPAVCDWKYGEWLEVYNATDHDVDLDGLRVGAGYVGGTFTWTTVSVRPAHYWIVGPRSYTLITPMAPTGCRSPGAAPDWFMAADLLRGGEDLWLASPTVTIDAAYRPNGAYAVYGSSLQFQPSLTPPTAVANDDRGGWCVGGPDFHQSTSTTPDMGTPALPNDCTEDLTSSGGCRERGPGPFQCGRPLPAFEGSCVLDGVTYDIDQSTGPFGGNTNYYDPSGCLVTFESGSDTNEFCFGASFSLSGGPDMSACVLTAPLPTWDSGTWWDTGAVP